MQYTQKEILEAIALIKTVCWENINDGKSDCQCCPLYSVSNGCCVFSADGNPSDWELNNPDRTWHAVF